MAIDQQILAVLADIAETDAVQHDPDLALYDLHILDSLSTVELMIAFEERFGIELSPASFEREQWATPRKVVADIVSKIGQ